LQSLSQ